MAVRVSTTSTEWRVCWKNKAGDTIVLVAADEAAARSFLDGTVEDAWIESRTVVTYNWKRHP